MKKGSLAKFIIIGIVLAGIIAAYFFHITHTEEDYSEEAVETVSSAVSDVLLRDLEKSYPPTPKEVVKYFNDITKVFYGENLSDSDIEKLGMKIQGIYDDELVANKPYTEYINDLKSDIATMKSNDCTIMNYNVSASTDVEYFYMNGDEYCARLYSYYSMRQGTDTFTQCNVFILRQDSDKHWKILGWEPYVSDETN